MKLKLVLAMALLCGSLFSAMGETNSVTLPDIVISKPGYEAVTSETNLVGVYQQPEWTEYRRFPTTRVYLQKEPMEVGVEQWVRSKINEGERTTHRVQTEAEIGLPYRMQLDLYVNSEINDQGTYYYDNFATELRYAFADWGKIPLNPTVYGEYKIKDSGPDVGEAKILVGDQLPYGFNWGYNLAYEWDLGGTDRTQEIGHSAGISRAVIDRVLSLGVETRYTRETVAGERDNPEVAWNLGPSVQWRMTEYLSLDVAPLFALTDDAPDILSYVVLSYDVGSVKSPHNPVSSRAN